jgi:hypothetical protein
MPDSEDGGVVPYLGGVRVLFVDGSLQTQGQLGIGDQVAKREESNNSMGYQHNW